MDVVILAAGKGERLKPLTNTIPKPLLKIQNKSIIELLLLNLPSNTSKIVIVVSYLSHLIRKKIGSNFKGIEITYVTQNPDCYGTMCALLSVINKINGDFLVICSDNIYEKNDLNRLVVFRNSYLALKLSNEERIIKYPFAKKSILSTPLENEVILDLGAWYINKDITKAKTINVSNSKEIGIPQTLKYYSTYNNISFNPVWATNWYPVGNIEEYNIVKNL